MFHVPGFIDGPTKQIFTSVDFKCHILLMMCQIPRLTNAAEIENIRIAIQPGTIKINFVTVYMTQKFFSRFLGV